MSCNCSESYSLYRGRNSTLRVKVYGAGDMTGSKVWFTVKKESSDVTALILKRTANNGGADIQVKITDPWIVDTNPESPTFGERVSYIEIYLLPIDTVNFEAGYYWFDIVAETSVGKVLQIKPPSQFIIQQAITTV